jgi:hypothetical protein
MELGTQEKRQMKMEARDLRERTVGLLGTIWLPREASRGIGTVEFTWRRPSGIIQ